MRALESEARILGTVAKRSTSFTDAIKREPEVTLIDVCLDNRDNLVETISGLLLEI